MARRLKCLSVLVGGLSVIAGACFAGQASAQDGAMTELYGYGVHRFYAGDYSEAQRVLNMVVESGIDDPRAHFFRGLTQHNLGNLEEAKADFEQAALLEARGRRAVNVSYALQRIQGAVRQEIEMSRMMARVAVYKELRESGQIVPGVTPAVPVPPSGDNAFPPVLSGDTPAGNVPPAVATPPATTPGVVPPAGVPPIATPPGTVPDAQLDPFRDDPAGNAPTPPTSDPFGTPDTSTPAPVTPAPSAPSPATPATPAAPTDDPFGTSTTPAAPSTPAAPADTSSDPFAEPAAPATPSAASPAPAANATDPFAPAP